MKQFANEGKPLYLDNHLVVFDKPAGISTQPEFHAFVKSWLKEALHKKGEAFIEPVHRLDKVACGLVLFAKTSKALIRLHEALQERKIAKYYMAQVEGILEKKEGELRHFLFHADHRALLDSHKGKESILSYKVLKEERDRTSIFISLQTGRYHQIRAQFAAIGHPLIGDRKYGSKYSDPRLDSGAIALHHFQMEFIHPVTKEKMEITSLLCPFFSKIAKDKKER